MIDVEVLRSSTLLAGCSEIDVDRLSSIAETREFADGESLFHQGDGARELMIVETGRVQLEFPVDVLGQQKTVAFEVKETGSVLGWSTLGQSGRLTLTARAVGRVRVISMPQADLEAVLTVNADLGVRLLRNVLSVVHRRLEQSHAMLTREIQRSVDGLYR